MLDCAEYFIDFLDSKEITFDSKEDDDGDVTVTIPYEGKRMICIFSGENGKFLSIYCFYEETPAGKVYDMIDVCNQLNKTYKWVKFYLDKDNDVTAQIDALLTRSTAADVAFDMLIRMIDILKEAKPIIMRGLYN